MTKHFGYPDLCHLRVSGHAELPITQGLPSSGPVKSFRTTSASDTSSPIPPFTYSASAKRIAGHVGSLRRSPCGQPGARSWSYLPLLARRTRPERAGLGSRACSVTSEPAALTAEGSVPDATQRAFRDGGRGAHLRRMLRGIGQVRRSYHAAVRCEAPFAPSAILTTVPCNPGLSELRALALQAARSSSLYGRSLCAYKVLAPWRGQTKL